MSHEIMENDNMMYVRADGVPWHGLGVPVDGAQKSEDAIKVAGLDWEVQLKDTFTMVDGQIIRVPDYKTTVRMDKNIPLGIVGNRYTVIQNKDAFNMMDEIVGTNAAMYHTVGSLQNGKKLWLLVKLPDVCKVRDIDVIEKYLLLTTTHDGSWTLKCMFTPVRVVCANTLRVAMKNSVGNEVSIRHTANATKRIDEARRILGITLDYYKIFEEKANFMASQPFTEIQMKMLAANLLPSKEDEIATRTQNNRDSLIALFENGLGNAPFRGTAWAAYNAVTEYTDHVRGTRGDNKEEQRLSSIWFGSAATMKDKAFSFIDTQIAL